jgi:tRNA-dihydrouridine synthase A
MRIGTVTGGTPDTADALQRFDAADEAALLKFVESVTRAGSQVAIVHARKAVLGGWSPKDNREVPPLRYDVAERVRTRFAPLPVVVNGGVRTAEQATALLARFDGVMLGREAYHRPLVLAEIAGRKVSTRAVLLAMADYVERELVGGERLQSITRHMLGLMTHAPGARDYRRLLSEGARVPGTGPELLRQAAERFGH